MYKDCESEGERKKVVKISLIFNLNFNSQTFKKQIHSEL